MRMFLEPHLISPGSVRLLDSRYVPFFDKTLREIDDDELLETAALSLARVAREKLQDISRATDILLKHLESHSNLRVRFACARALVNADVSQAAEAVLKLDEFADDSQRLWIDPALAHWNFTAAGDIWKKRLAADSETAVAVSLACDGLAALGDAHVSDLLQSVLHGELLAFEKRKAAARALSALTPDLAFNEAESLIDGNVLERLLAIQLLSSAKPEAHARLFHLCADASDGIASAAWAALFRVNPEVLIPALPMGRSHRDAVVRMTAAHIMRRFPDVERSGWLMHLYPDEAVRDAVRKHLMRNEEMFKNPALIPAGANIELQSSYLIQFAGLERLKDLQAFLEPNLSKSEPGGVLKRLAAMWALGLFYENDPDPALAKSFIGRVADRSGIMPEREPVRRMSAIALGLMRAKSAVPGLLEAYELDPGESLIPGSARWSLGMIGNHCPIH